MMEDLFILPAAVVVALLVRRYGFCFTRVKGRSMTPTLRDGQWTVVARWVYHVRPPRRGEVVICFFPGRRMKHFPFLRQLFVKRVIGLPGETVAWEDGVVLVDGRPLWEPYLVPAYTRMRTTRPPVTLGPDEYYLLGDHRDASRDSRAVGPIRQRDIVGRVIVPVCAGAK